MVFYLHKYRGLNLEQANGLYKLYAASSQSIKELLMALKERVSNPIDGKSLGFFRNLKLFTDLPDEEVVRFASVAQIKKYKKGELLYTESEQANFFYVICSGWLKLFHTTPEGEEVILAMLTKNSITGVKAVCEEGCFAMSAQVVEGAEILSIPLSLLKERLRANNQLALNMLSFMVQQERKHELQLQQYILYSAPQRIGCFLLGLCPVLEQKDGAILNLPYDKALIASALGMQAPTFSRALNILREETGIQICDARVTIDSIESLLTFVDGCYSHPRLYKNLS